MKIVKDDSQGWFIANVSDSDKTKLIEYIKEVYSIEQYEMSEEDFEARAEETANSIIKNDLEDIYVDLFDKDEFFVIVPVYGFGAIELYFKEVIV